MKKVLFFLLFSMVITACQKLTFSEQVPNALIETDEYLIFGGFAQECFGNCTRIFKIENGQIFTDDVDWGIPDEIPFLESPLDNAKYELAKHLVEEFPDDLLESSKRTYGCPDCGDQGGYYLELELNGAREVWLIDRHDDEQSQAIIDFKNELDSILQQL